MPFLPEPLNGSTGRLTSRQAAKAQRDQTKAELTVFGHTVPVSKPKLTGSTVRPWPTLPVLA